MPNKGHLLTQAVIIKWLSRSSWTHNKWNLSGQSTAVVYWQPDLQLCHNCSCDSIIGH